MVGAACGRRGVGFGVMGGDGARDWGEAGAISRRSCVCGFDCGV